MLYNRSRAVVIHVPHVWTTVDSCLIPEFMFRSLIELLLVGAGSMMPKSTPSEVYATVGDFIASDRSIFAHAIAMRLHNVPMTSLKMAVIEVRSSSD